jgi:hypothetical protein
MVSTTERSLDAGRPFVLWETGPDREPPKCGSGVWIATEMDAIATIDDDVTLVLRHAERHDSGPSSRSGAPVRATMSLSTGRCVPSEEGAERLLQASPWLGNRLAGSLERLRERARRFLAQRDRTSCRTALATLAPGDLVPYEHLFPEDWDLLFSSSGRGYWAVDQHCISPACTCTDIVVELHRIESIDAILIGSFRFDSRESTPRPKASTRVVAGLFHPLWTMYGAELVRRRAEVRDAVVRAAASRCTEPTPPRSPSRSAPCSCGSGKKYKRCCADRDALRAR